VLGIDALPPFFCLFFDLDLNYRGVDVDIEGKNNRCLGKKSRERRREKENQGNLSLQRGKDMKGKKKSTS
jgi:hypothetical protein